MQTAPTHQLERQRHIMPLTTRPTRWMIEAVCAQLKPRAVLALNADKPVVFGASSEPFVTAPAEMAHLNWPLTPEMAALEQNLILRDAIFPKYIALIRQGYLAKAEIGSTEAPTCLYVTGAYSAQALRDLLRGDAAATLRLAVFEDCVPLPDALPEGWVKRAAAENDPCAIWCHPEVLATLDDAALFAARQRDLDDRAAHAARRRQSLADRQELSDAIKAKLVPLMTWKTKAKLRMMYTTAALLALFSKRRGAKMRVSAQKRDLRQADLGYNNRLLRNYKDRKAAEAACLAQRHKDGAPASASPRFGWIIDGQTQSVDEIYARIRQIAAQNDANHLVLVTAPAAKHNALAAATRDMALDVVVQAPPTQASYDEGIRAAVRLCDAEYFLFDQPQVQYAPHLLAEIRHALAVNPKAALAYYNTERLDETGTARPIFKSAWNKDLFYSTNYIATHAALHRDLIEADRPSATHSAQSVIYAALLDLIERGEEDRILHLSPILASEAPAPMASRTTEEQALLEAHLNRHYHPAPSVRPVTAAAHRGFRLEWSAQDSPLVSILMPTHNHLDMVERSVRSLLEKTDYANFELLVIDNNTNEPDTLAWLAQVERLDPRIRLLRDARPFNFSALNNAAFCHAKGEVILLLNNDIEVINAGWLRELVAQALRPEVGCVGAKLIYPSGEIQNAGVCVDVMARLKHLLQMTPADQPGYEGRLLFQQSYLASTGACIAIRRDLYAAIGGLNQIEMPIGCSDIDLCFKTQALGLVNIWTPHAALYHYESVSRGADKSRAKRARAAAEHDFMRQRWDMKGHLDPYFDDAITETQGL